MGVLGFGLKGQPGEIMTGAYDESAPEAVAFDMTSTKAPIETADGFKVEMTVTIEKLREFRMHIDGILQAADAAAERKAAQAAEAEAVRSAQIEAAAGEPDAPAKKTRRKK